MTLEGVLAPVPTPFTSDADDGGLDLAAWQRNVTQWMQTDLVGILVLGTNGESAYVDDGEADRLIAAAREIVPATRTLMAGTARESTRATIAATRRAGEMGVDAVLVRPPSFLRSLLTSDNLLAHFRAVADASTVPVLLYNFPAAFGVNLTPAQVAALAEHPNIVGIKESSGNVLQVSKLVAATGSDFQVLVGSAQSFYASLTVGAVGGVLALACIQPALCERLRQLAVDRQHDEALALQQRLIPLAELVTSGFGVPGLKAALDLLGYAGGAPRRPLSGCSPEGVEQIRQALAAIDAWAGVEQSA